MTITLKQTITSTDNSSKTVKIYYNSYIEEYIAVPAINNKNLSESYWYYTDNKKDCLQTAQYMLEHHNL